MAHKPKIDQIFCSLKCHSCGHFTRGNNSPSHWARELFKPSKDSWRYV